MPSDSIMTYNSQENTYNEKQILVVENSSFHRRIYSLFLQIYDVTITDDINLVSKDYDLIILSGNLYCDKKIDHPCILRYAPMKMKRKSGNYLYMPLTEK